MENKKLVSIITVVFNAAETLERTIRSVLAQKEDLYEYWIIDGKSTDGSIDIIKKYEKHITGWISEKDYGIYDAMNKGLDRAKGEWVYFLGGDDVLVPNAIEMIKNNLHTQFDMVYGNVLFSNGHHYVSKLGIRTLLQNTVHHQGAFYNIKIFENYRYDVNLTIVSEYDIHLDIYVHQKKTLYVPITLAKCDIGGASSNLRTSLAETNRVRRKHLKGDTINKTLSMLLKLYYFQKHVRFLLYKHRV